MITPGWTFQLPPSAIFINPSFWAPRRPCRSEIDEFDVVWSVWTLEHIPNPEQALREIRRVTKDKGFIYLEPAWYCQLRMQHRATRCVLFGPQLPRAAHQGEHPGAVLGAPGLSSSMYGWSDTSGGAGQERPPP